MPTDWSPAGADRVIHGDNLEVIAGLPDASFTLVYLDPPYYARVIGPLGYAASL